MSFFEPVIFNGKNVFYLPDKSELSGFRQIITVDIARNNPSVARNILLNILLIPVRKRESQKSYVVFNVTSDFTQQKLPNTVQKLPDTVQKPPDTAQKPPDTAQKPPDTAQKPPNTAQKPPNTAQKSPISAQKSPISAQKWFNPAQKFALYKHLFVLKMSILQKRGQLFEQFPLPLLPTVNFINIIN
jgi:hypothetical protein